MIFLNKLDNGKRWLIESDNDHPMQRIVLLPSELLALAEKLSFRLTVKRIGRGSSGLVAELRDGQQIHLAFSEEVPELLEELRQEFPSPTGLPQ